MSASNQVITLALSGGGAKGVCYLGVIEALEKLGLRQQIEEFRGVSVGAITAMLLSIGMTATEMKQFTNDLDFTALLGKELWNKNPELLKRKLKDAIQQKKGSENNLNFGKLQALIVEQSHSQVKNLTVTVLEPQTMRKKFISSKTRSDSKVKDSYIDASQIGIVDAVVASAAIPFVVMPQEINGVQYVDGGYRNNIPDDKSQPLQGQLVCVFDDGDCVTQGKNLVQQGRLHSKSALYRFSWKEKIKRNYLASLLSPVGKTQGKYGITRSHTEQKEKDLRRLLSRPESNKEEINKWVLGVKTAGLESSDFAKAKEMSDVLALLNYFHTMKHCLVHGLGNKQNNRELIISQMNLGVMLCEHLIQSCERWGYKGLSSEGNQQGDKKNRLFYQINQLKKIEINNPRDWERVCDIFKNYQQECQVARRRWTKQTKSAELFKANVRDLDIVPNL